ncbi:MAG: TonB-dependent receptor plug domain-containing protein [Gammaproteobacteria bacterium]|nr:TonB-dependent receptor plug domain-containing protein [Gammaproteobacteria bacterium]
MTARRPARCPIRHGPLRRAGVGETCHAVPSSRRAPRPLLRVAVVPALRVRTILIHRSVCCRRPGCSGRHRRDPDRSRQSHTPAAGGTRRQRPQARRRGPAQFPGRLPHRSAAHRARHRPESQRRPGQPDPGPDARGSEANHTLVLLDGLEANDPATGSEFDFAHLRATTIESAEVLPGPSGALWGSDAIGGAIALRTPRARGPMDWGLRLAGGERDLREATVRVGHVGERFEVNAVADHFTTDGSNVARRGEERDGYRVSTLALHGALELSDSVRLQGILRTLGADVEFDPAPAPDFLPADGDRETDARRTLGGTASGHRSRRRPALHRLTLEQHGLADSSRAAPMAGSPTSVAATAAGSPGRATWNSRHWAGSACRSPRRSGAGGLRPARDRHGLRRPEPEPDPDSPGGDRGVAPSPRRGPVRRCPPGGRGPP